MELIADEKKKIEKKLGLNRQQPTISGKFDCFCSLQFSASHLKDNENPIKLNIYDFAFT